MVDNDRPLTRQEKRVAAREQRRAAQRVATLAAKETAVSKPSPREGSINTVIWGIGFPSLLFFIALGVGTAFAMTSSESAGFLVAKACFAAAAFDCVAMAVYWAVATRQPTPWNIAFPTVAALIVVPVLVLSLQWLGAIETKLSTRLIPGSKPTPTLPTTVPDAMLKDALLVFFGSSAALIKQTPFALLTIKGETMIELDKTKSGDGLVVTVLKIFDDRNNIIARLDDGEFWVENSTRSKRPNPSTLVVYDHYDKEVLHLEFLNSGALSITGVFRHPGFRTPAVITANQVTLPNGNVLRGSVMGGRGIAFD